jgi:hypothetical protein
MNKKLLVVSILAVFMLVVISFSTAISSNTTTTVKKKESPLFGIRTRLAIGENLQDLKERIKARFIGERVFFLPFQLLRNRDVLIRSQTYIPSICYTYCGAGCFTLNECTYYVSCDYTSCLDDNTCSPTCEIFCK